MHTTIQECQNALEATRAEVHGLTRTIAATLAHMYPHAAYLVLRREPHSGELHLDSLRTASGCIQHTFGQRPEQLPELEDPELQRAWGEANPRDPQSLLHILRALGGMGARLDTLPDAALEQADPDEDTECLRCLVVNANAPEPAGHDREVTVRVAMTVTEEVTYEFTAEIELPARIANNPRALYDYLNDQEDTWLDQLDPLSGVTVNERSLDNAELRLAA
ncbi:hypothetical protein [Streptomyces zaomyceticus]|uniref:hypothetical protein n=1 Tax=Streptomyces zaomyceticus TaxID=68286 RepID=UPI0036AF7580